MIREVVRMSARSEDLKTISPETQFLASQRNKASTESYRKMLRLVFASDASIQNADAFLELAKTDRQRAQDFISNWIIKNREKLRGATIRTYLAAVRSFLDFHEANTVNWKKLIKSSPKISVSDDRPPTLDEVRRLFDPADSRLKFLITLLASSGIRIGGAARLQVRDLTEIEIEGKKIGSLIVYRGEPESYRTFVSLECIKYWESYQEERIAAGEKTVSSKGKDGTEKKKLDPKAPLIRKEFDHDIPTDAVPVDSETLQAYLKNSWKRVGFGEKEFKSCHGFRKFFKTKLENDGAKTIVIETLLGHVSEGNQAAYFRPSSNELQKTYFEHTNALIISEAVEAKRELEEVRSETTRSLKDYKTDLILANQRIANLEESKKRDIELLLSELKAQRARLEKIESLTKKRVSE